MRTVNEQIKLFTNRLRLGFGSAQLEISSYIKRTRTNFQTNLLNKSNSYKFDSTRIKSYTFIFLYFTIIFNFIMRTS
jgi:hypothetical protein